MKQTVEKITTSKYLFMASFIPVQGQALQKYAREGHKMIQKWVISDIA